MSRQPPWLLPLIIATALFMENLDATVLSTALPVMSRDLGVSPIALKLALTSYMVSLAVFIPLSGWMADRFGARRIFRGAMVVFMAGSIACAMCHSVHALVLARFLQGMGGAMMVPVGRLVLLRSVSRADLVRATGYLAMPALVGPVIGPPLGGFISTWFDWRWIFLINLPMCALGLWAAGRFIPALREADVPPLDLKGFFLSAAGLTLLMLGLSSSEHLVSRETAVLAACSGAGLLLAYGLHARRHPHPVLDPALFATPTFRAGVLGGFVFRVGIGTIPFLLPLMLQLGFGFSAFHSGMLTCVTAIGAIFMKTMTTRVLERFGFRRVLIWNTLLCAVSIMAFAAFDADTPYPWMVAVFMAGGCMRSLQFTSLNAISYADIGQDALSRATSLASVVQQLAAGFGVTAAATALTFAMWVDGSTRFMPADFRLAFLIMGGVTMLSSLSFVRLPRNAGAALARS